MEASTSYNDLTGTIAADITDHGHGGYNLDKVLSEYGLDKEKYTAIGLHYYCGFDRDSGNIDLDIILKDLNTADRVVKKRITLKIEEFFSLFKRLDFYLVNNNINHNDIHTEHLDRIDED